MSLDVAIMYCVEGGSCGRIDAVVEGIDRSYPYVV